MLKPIEIFKKERKAYFRDGMQDIVEGNLQMLTELSLLSTILTCFFILITPIIVRGWTPTPPHLLLIPSSALFFIIAVFYRKREGKSESVIKFMCLAFIACLLTLIIGIDVYQSADQPSCFMQAMLIVIPCLFVFPFRVIYAEMLVFEVIYVILIFRQKNMIMIQNDCFSSVVGFVLSFFVAYIIQRLRAEAYNSKYQYKQLSMVDGLTGTLNKSNFEYLVKKYLEHCGESEYYALLILDVDNFKNINDSMGHQVGDTVLESIGEILPKTFRGTDIMGRFGGDEFVVLMRSLPGEEIVEQKCKLLFGNFQKLSERLRIELTCSVGGIFLGSEFVEYEQMFQMADKILYEVKAAGKARYHIQSINQSK